MEKTDQSQTNLDRNQFLSKPAHEQENILATLLGLVPKSGQTTQPCIDRKPVLEQQLKANGLEHQTLVSVFESVVKRNPQGKALVFNDQSMKYELINRKANQVAHYLLKQQSKGKHIAVFLEPSFEVIVAILGILKAGLAYVPIDTKNAKERIRSILDDMDLEIVLTTGDHLSLLPLKKELAVDMDQTSLFETEDVENPRINLQETDGAYVIYTSGSTGKPKGVLVSHYNVVSLFYGTESLFDFSHKDVWTLFHSTSFDFSVWEMWGALLKGGSLVIVPFAVSRNYPKFYQLLIDEQVTVLNQTPTAFRLLIETDTFGSGSTSLALRYIILGGEAFHASCLKTWFERHAEDTPHIINMYGITETTVHVTFRKILMEDVNSQESLVGSELPHLSLYLLDENKNPVPFGQEGEIYVGGLGVSQGYWKREKLSNEKFVQNPFIPVPGSTLYRSGDLGRFKSNGELSYLGRIDNQVQLRGYRIELGEIEWAMSQLDVVQDSIATLDQEHSDDPKIVVYFKTAQGNEIDHKTIRQKLKPFLPEYMLPDVTRKVQDFPVNQNGKFDLAKVKTVFQNVP